MSLDPRSPSMTPRAVQLDTVLQERTICIRIALEVARRRHLAGDENGATATEQFARFMRDDGFPELRQLPVQKTTGHRSGQ